MPFGYTGKILRVDLSNAALTVEVPAPEEPVTATTGCTLDIFACLSNTFTVETN